MNGYSGVYGHHNGGYNSFDMMTGGYFMTVLLVGAIVLFLLLIFKNKKQQTKGSLLNNATETNMEAEEVVKLRYARGEISHDEFQSILKTIKA